MAANRELTRAIQALTAENQQGRADSTKTGSETGAGDPRDEELAVLNEELRAIIEQLSIKNDDLEARAHELRAAALSAENASFQLSAVMNAVGDVVVVVDHEQAVILQSESVEDLIVDDPRALQFLDSAGNPLEGTDSPLARVAQGENFSLPVQITTPQGAVRSYEAVGRPSGAIGNRRLGVLTLRLSGDSLERVLIRRGRAVRERERSA